MNKRLLIILSIFLLVLITHVGAYEDDIYSSEEDVDLRRRHTQRRSAGGVDEEAERAEKAEREEDERKRREKERASFSAPRGGNEQEEYMRMTITSCIWLTKIKMSNSQKDLSAVADVFKSNSKSQTGVFKKITGELMEICFQNINIETAKRFLEEANKEKDKFDFASFEFVFNNWNHKKYLNKNADITLSNDQEALYKYVEEFEKMMAEREGRNPQDGSPAQTQEEEEYFYKPKPEDSEPRIFGISLKLDSLALQLVYVGAFVVLVIFIIYYGLKQIQLMNNPYPKRVKKEKKRK